MKWGIFLLAALHQGSCLDNEFFDFAMGCRTFELRGKATECQGLFDWGAIDHTWYRSTLTPNPGTQPPKFGVSDDDAVEVRLPERTVACGNEHNVPVYCSGWNAYRWPKPHNPEPVCSYIIVNYFDTDNSDEVGMYRQVDEFVWVKLDRHAPWKDEKQKLQLLSENEDNLSVLMTSSATKLHIPRSRCSEDSKMICNTFSNFPHQNGGCAYAEVLDDSSQCRQGIWGRNYLHDTHGVEYFGRQVLSRESGHDSHETEWTAQYPTDFRLRRRSDGAGSYIFDCLTNSGNVLTQNVKVQCKGSHHVKLQDRVWPPSYVPPSDFVDGYGKCPMLRVLSSGGFEMEGFYMVQPDGKHYIRNGVLDPNPQDQFVLYRGANSVSTGLWRNCKMSPDGPNSLDCTEHRAGVDPRMMTCVSAGHYCPFIRVTYQETGNGDCMGNYRLVSERVLHKFDLKTYGDRQFVDEKNPQGGGQVELRIVEDTDPDRLRVECLNFQDNLLQAKFYISRSRCFVNGSYDLGDPLF